MTTQKLRHGIVKWSVLTVENRLGKQVELDNNMG